MFNSNSNNLFFSYDNHIMLLSLEDNRGVELFQQAFGLIKTYRFSETIQNALTQEVPLFIGKDGDVINEPNSPLDTETAYSCPTLLGDGSAIYLYEVTPDNPELEYKRFDNFLLVSKVLGLSNLEKEAWPDKLRELVKDDAKREAFEKEAALFAIRMTFEET